MIVHSDCLAHLRAQPDNSVDSIVTDPPYGISFMGKKWDYDVPSVEVWRECLRVLKPGGHMLAACGTRTQHRMVVNIEDAGFEVRDVVCWHYATGFPKNQDVSKFIDKSMGAKGKKGALKRGGERLARLVDGKRDGEGTWGDESGRDPHTYEPSSAEAKQWQGWGTAIKPATEFFTLCRKPLLEKTVAANVLAHGTGALNVDGCRVEHNEILARPPLSTNKHEGWQRPWNESHEAREAMAQRKAESAAKAQDTGRWPANIIFDETMAAELDKQSGVLKSGALNAGHKQGVGGTVHIGKVGNIITRDYGGDSGGASRFFFCAKASKKDRGPGNTHPTCKPTKLMAYLCRLITPPGGLVLDPFAGSGSTGVGAVREGFQFLGIEREAEYVEIARRRLAQEMSERESA